MTPHEPIEERAFYTTLAQHYDQIYSHIDFKQRALFYNQLIDRFKQSTGNQLMDLCCGTGIYTSYFAEFGYRSAGMDLSPEMLEVARGKYPDINFEIGDIRYLSLEQDYDVVICLFNSILYSQPLDLFHKTLKNTYNSLSNGGVFLFDLVDKTAGINPRNFDYTSTNGLKIRFQPRWNYSGTGEILDLEIRFTFTDGFNTNELIDRHKMCAVDILEIKVFMEELGFEVWSFDSNTKELRELSDGARSAIMLGRK